MLDAAFLISSHNSDAGKTMCVTVSGSSGRQRAPDLRPVAFFVGLRAQVRREDRWKPTRASLASASVCASRRPRTRLISGGVRLTRPGPGVRSVSEVLMHTASGNYFSLQSMGVKAGEDLPKNAEKSVTAKADVVRWLKASFEAVQENYPKIDKQKS